MLYELKAPLMQKCTFTDDRFSIGDKIYLYDNITAVSLLVRPTRLTNGVIQIIVDGFTLTVAFPYKQRDEGMDVYLFLSRFLTKKNKAFSVIEENNDSTHSLVTADEVYNYCITHGYGTGFNKHWGLQHFQLIVDNLMSDEKIIFPFIGLHNYKSTTNHNNNFAYAVTNKRILMAQKKVIGQNFQSINLQNINDITFTTGVVLGIVTIDTYKERFNIGLNKILAQNIHTKIHEVFDSFQNKSEVSSPIATPSTNPYEELKKLKELLDAGIITEDEFTAKKKQLLDL